MGSPPQLWRRHTVSTPSTTVLLTIRLLLLSVRVTHLMELLCACTFLKWSPLLTRDGSMPLDVSSRERLLMNTAGTCQRPVRSGPLDLMEQDQICSLTPPRELTTFSRLRNLLLEDLPGLLKMVLCARNKCVELDTISWTWFSTLMPSTVVWDRSCLSLAVCALPLCLQASPVFWSLYTSVTYLARRMLWVTCTVF